MKRYKHYSSGSPSFNHAKHRAKLKKQEYSAGGFRCAHCRQFVVINDIMGTVNRNHCNSCLWSKHVDTAKGDRKASCKGGMRPIGLTFKHEGIGRTGELMLIHSCTSCEKISINRLARDDFEPSIFEVFKRSNRISPEARMACRKAGIYMLTQSDSQELHIQLFGNTR